jgi:hypothetical protein
MTGNPLTFPGTISTASQPDQSIARIVAAIGGYYPTGQVIFIRALLVTPHRNPEFLAICVFPVAFRVFPSETAEDGDLVTYASYGFGEEWLHHNS